MTNSKSRNTGTMPTANQQQLQQQRNAAAAAARFFDEPQSTSPEAGDINVQGGLPALETENNDGEEDDDDEGEDELDSCSSFSLEECINEFRARRVRRLSTHSREREAPLEEGAVVKQVTDQDEVDLIQQNRSNKEQERKCKPCRNGFCYCFTSDSGDGGRCGGDALAARGAHVRQPRRSRKSESSQFNQVMPQQQQSKTAGEQRRQSAPANLKTVPKVQNTEQQSELPMHKAKPVATFEVSDTNGLTAVSRLETTTGDNAPLIHIIQELRNNCVISEVRVNRNKIQAQPLSRFPARPDASSTTTTATATTTINSSPGKAVQRQALELHMPTAPPLEMASSLVNDYAPTAPALKKITELNTLPEAMAYPSALNGSVKSSETSKRRERAAGGRLLQKRLSQEQMARARRSSQPPPKPPRSYHSLGEKSSVSSLASTSPSVREAERIIDEFLRRRGVKVPSGQKPAERREQTKRKVDRSVQTDYDELRKVNDAYKRDKRKSCPLIAAQTKQITRKSLPRYPSLSDFERNPEDKGKNYGNFEKNIRQAAQMPVKELTFGWKEPKISEMLNYDRNGNQRKFKSKAVQAEPQQSIGWQLPPKLDIDTVDGVDAVRHNLASNIETKNTPVKRPPIATRKHSTNHPGWTEHLRNFSPWAQKKTHNGNRNIKSNLKLSSRSLFDCSKKKILRLVTPKKERRSRQQKTLERQLRTVGVQTLPEERSYELSVTPQSPPGSYHSAVQTSMQSTTPTCSQNTQQLGDFDFTRTVSSPPKKAPRARNESNRKLNFPLDACLPVPGRDRSALKASMKTKTYRSYHGDLDQDATLSKLGYILGNIRAKLEASDDHAVRTFQEIERREQHATGLDCTDSAVGQRLTFADVHSRRGHYNADAIHDPIYSEIEEDSIHISGAANYDNTTAIQAGPVVVAPGNPEVLYAKVNKPQRMKKATAPAPPTALGKILHDSLRNATSTPLLPLPPLPELPSSNVSYTSPTNDDSFLSNISHFQSLNNIRVKEQHSPPKKERQLSKSDLSLHRSEIFLDNLCRSEINLENGELERLEKVNNHEREKRILENRAGREFSTSTPTPNDSISYDTPDDANADSVFQRADNQLNLSIDETPSYSRDQRTPKQPTRTFTTKSPQRSSSCPVTPQKCCPAPPLSHSLIEVCPADNDTLMPAAMHSTLNNSRDTQTNAANSSFSKFYLTHYNRLKTALRKSFRRSKKFVRNETQRLSSSFSFPSSRASYTPHPIHNQNPNQTDVQVYSGLSTFDLKGLFALDDEEPVTQQLAKAVSICRQLPDLEISQEMVEAERLLLFSALRREVRWPEPVAPQRPIETTQQQEQQQHQRRFYIDTMRLPVRADANKDIFFNYFYIVTFECGGIIKSTQSAECHNGEAMFRDCGIEFSCALSQDEVEIRCEVFMLRLRKLSTLSLEPRRTIVKIPNPLTASSKSSSSSEEITSRFRLHATFTLSARDFRPYEYVESESKSGDKICLRAARGCKLPLFARTKSTNLQEQVELIGRAEVRVPKNSHSGFLNVQDPHTLHSWNLRWVTLNGLQLGIWSDASERTLAKEPLLSLDLRGSLQSLPLQVAPRELCARPRSFCVECALKKAGEEVATAAVFFAADTQAELNAWLEQLNKLLALVCEWMC